VVQVPRRPSQRRQWKQACSSRWTSSFVNSKRSRGSGKESSWFEELAGLAGGLIQQGRGSRAEKQALRATARSERRRG
jgi:hypothetical protein